MLRAQAGDRQAIASLIERHHRDMFLYFSRLAGDRGLAEELTQECFLRLVRCTARYSPLRPVRPWLYAVAANLWRDHLRRAARRREVAAAAAGTGTLDPSPSVEDQVTRRLLADRLGAAVRALPPETAQALVLRFCHDLRVREIAEILGTREGTVKSRLFYGLRRLRVMLESEEVAAHGQATPASPPG